MRSQQIAEAEARYTHAQNALRTAERSGVWVAIQEAIEALERADAACAAARASSGVGG